MAKFPSIVIASHQSAMNFSNLMYAFPAGISSAMAIVVSYEIGAKRYDDVKKYCRLGRVTALLISGFTLVFLNLLRNQVASLYGTNSEFIALTSIFLTYSLFFQLADTFAAPLQGILRGYKDTQVPFYLGLIAYWGVSLPLGLLLLPPDSATTWLSGTVLPAWPPPFRSRLCLQLSSFSVLVLREFAINLCLGRIKMYWRNDGFNHMFTGRALHACRISPILRHWEVLLRSTQGL